MRATKYLSDSAWKDVAAKNDVKDNGLLRKLAEFRKLDDRDYDDALKLLAEAASLAGQLMKAKGTPPPAGKYLDEVVAAADEERRAVAKARKAAAAKSSKGGSRDDEAGQKEKSAASELLGPRLKPLLRRVVQGDTAHALVSRKGQQVVVLLSRKPILPAQRKLMTEHLGGGSVKHYTGVCRLEDGATTFSLNVEVTGLAKLLKAALLAQTGLRVSKLECRAGGAGDAAQPAST